MFIGTNNADREGTTAMCKIPESTHSRGRSKRELARSFCQGFYRSSEEEPMIQELEEDGDQHTSAAAMHGRGRVIRGFVAQLCGEGGDVYEGLPAP